MLEEVDVEGDCKMRVSYVCDGCRGTFEEEEERHAEAVKEESELFGVTDNHVRICHRCWVNGMKTLEKQGVVDSTWRKYL